MEDTKKVAARTHYKTLRDMSVDMYTLEEDPAMQLMRGRALLNPEKKEFAFVQNTPRGPRSVEVGRTLHSRYVCRPDGGYTVTMRFEADEKNLREQLLAETREIVTMTQDHQKRHKAEKKKEAKRLEDIITKDTAKKLLPLANELHEVLEGEKGGEE